MRLTSYSVVNLNTMERVRVGCNRAKAEQVLKELQSKDNTNNYKVVTSWGNI